MSRAQPSAYDPRAAAGGLEAELVRLEAQAALSWPEERALIERALPRPDSRILEIGCAGGAVTERIRNAWPEAAITALEPEPDLLDRAARRLEGRGVHFAAGSIETNHLPEGHFDLALVRYVFQHLDGPVQAARTIMRKLAFGGTILAVDVDAELWGVAEPNDAAMAALHAAADRSQRGRGGDRLVGRRLAGILAAAGYAGPVLSTFCYHSGDRGLPAFEPQLSPERLLPAVARGDLAFADYLALVAAHKRFIADPEAFVLMLGFAASGTRPG